MVDKQANPQRYIKGKRASYITLVATERTMKQYIVFEHELTHFTVFNGMTTGFASAGSIFLGFGVSIVISWCTTSREIIENNAIFFQIGIWSCFILAVICYLLAGLFIWIARKTWRQIGLQTNEIKDKFVKPKD
jgi:hypothetical protein